jgi:ring-1,2-phenylacetyl-CoA epoxidase subunit PaaE
MAKHFYALTVSDVRRETEDCVSIAFDVPDALKSEFAFIAGQYVNLRATIGDVELRRSYSLCSAPHTNEWRVAIKRVEGGQFSQWANALLRVGDEIEVMPPDGRFLYKPAANGARHIVLLAAGSGITPILSILRSVLEREPKSRVSLIYGNRRVRDIIFKEAIEELRDRYLARFQLLHTLSAEPQETALASGRLNAEKVANVFASLIDPSRVDELYICGPNEMIAECVTAATQAGIAETKIHKELFGTPTLPTLSKPRDATNSDRADSSAVTVTADGIERTLYVPYRGDSVLEVALAAGIDAPYACKAGVCCTCRAQVLEGEVKMDANFTLEQHEIDRGFVLTCQSHPLTPTVKITFDAR